MGCAPSQREFQVNPGGPGPDVAKVTPFTAAGAPLKFQDEDEDWDRGPEPKRQPFENNQNEAVSVSINGKEDELKMMMMKKDIFPDEKEESNDGDKEDQQSENDVSTNSISARSRDSGISELSEEYAYVITETSEPEKVLQVESSFKEDQQLKLEIVGKKCSRKLSPKDKERFEEQNILSTLRAEGLVPRPTSCKQGGLKFEIVSSKVCPGGDATDYPGLRKLPPLSLQKALSKKRSQNLTKEDIEEKLGKAEERRKLQEENKLGKITVKPRTEEVLTTIEQQSQEIKEKHDHKMETKAKCREIKLKELQGKLRNHQQHVEKVRHRKQLINAIPDM